MAVRKKSWAEQLADQTEHLRRCALVYTHDPYTAQDLAQDVLLHAIGQQDKFDGHNLKGWLLVLTRNTFINQYRRESRWANPVDVSDGLHDALLLERSSQNEAQFNLTAQDLDKAIGCLPAKIQRIARLRMAGHKYEEIAEMESIPLGSVRSRLFRARLELPDRETF